MKVVVDTNVLVAGLLSPFGPPGEIVRMVAAGSLALCYDARILTEYDDVLTRPRFPFRREQVDALLNQIEAEGHSVAADPLPVRLPDPDDEPFLEVAVAGEVQCLITGNTRHFPGDRRQGVPVLTPAEFLIFYRAQSRKHRNRK